MKKLDLSLYLIVDPTHHQNTDFEKEVKDAVKNGVTIVQLREKNCSDESYCQLATKLNNILKPFKIPFILNDRVHLVHRLNADGVHLGQDDLPVREARNILDVDAIIGLSVESKEQIIEADSTLVDYIAVGPIYPTQTKKDYRRIWNLNELKTACKLTQIPVVAIGGIKTDSAADVYSCGVSGAAFISAFGEKENWGVTAKKLKSSFTFKTYPTALTIAGSDSGGGAGIQADLKTFSAIKVYGTSVITALTAQNTCEVTSIFEVTPKFVKAQIDAVLSDIKTNAVKIGMLHRKEIILTVANQLKIYSPPHIVIDPVMLSKSGAPLLNQDAIEIMKKELFPLATVITPNLPEASVLLSREVSTANEIEKAALDLLKFGSNSVLVKGGHLTHEDSSDCFAYKSATGEINIHWLHSKRIDTKNTHGTGCTLSAAIAAFLAIENNLFDAITLAKKYLTHAISSGAVYKTGSGHGPVNHFHSIT